MGKEGLWSGEDIKSIGKAMILPIRVTKILKEGVTQSKKMKKGRAVKEQTIPLEKRE